MPLNIAVVFNEKRLNTNTWIKAFVNFTGDSVLFLITLLFTKTQHCSHYSTLCQWVSAFPAESNLLFYHPDCPWISGDPWAPLRGKCTWERSWSRDFVLPLLDSLSPIVADGLEVCVGSSFTTEIISQENLSKKEVAIIRGGASHMFAKKHKFPKTLVTFVTVPLSICWYDN